MTPLEEIKILTNYTDDAKISLLISKTQTELTEKCKLLAYDATLDNILVDIVIIKLNRLGNEGVNNISASGMSESYADIYTTGDIADRLKKYTNKVVMY